MAFDKQADIVAAELLSVKDKVSLVDAIAFPAAGNHIAGLAGALVGASLVPAKLIYKWRVLRADGNYDVCKYSGDDPRNDVLMNMPYTPDYLKWRESERMMTDSMNDDLPVPQGEPVQMPAQGHMDATPNAQTPQSINNEVIIGAGNYTFGGNFPTGTFDLQVLTGEGSLWIYDSKGEDTYNRMGGDFGAMGWNGLSSDGNKSFTLEGSLRVRVTRAQMIRI